MIPIALFNPMNGHGTAPSLHSQGEYTPIRPDGHRRGWRIAGLTLIALLMSSPGNPAPAPSAAGKKAPHLRLIPKETPAPAAREDTARLVFQKTAETRKTRVYVVKKGDWLTRIVRDQSGDEPVPYALIRKMNPQIRDMNRIHPGQKIVLPLPGFLALPEPEQKENQPASPTYRIREGDSISRIILAELNTPPGEALKTYRLLRQLNPEIEDLNRLPAGEMLHLPQGRIRLQTPVEGQIPVVDTASLAASGSLPDEALTDEGAKTPPDPSIRLGFIEPVLARMKGSLTAQGQYFIPLQGATQITIDCSLIPVVELDDGTTALLDFGNRLSATLKEMIRQSWSNYAVLPAEELRDSLSGLQGIIRRSKNYLMTKPEKPLAVTPRQEVLAYPDWVIAAKKSVADKTYRQGLFMLAAGESPLPPEARMVLEKNDLFVTEIVDGRAIDPPPNVPAPPPVPQATDLRGPKGIFFAEQLLKALGEAPVLGAEVIIFEQDRDGFNLSVTADLLVQRGEKRLLVHTKRLPDQFISALKQGGTETLFIGPTEAGRPFLERILRGINLPFTAGYFSFRIPPEASRLRVTTAFSAVRVMIAGEPCYLIDFDISPDVLPLLQSRRAGTIIKY